VARLAANNAGGKFRNLMPLKSKLQYQVDDDGKFFYILTNENATDFRLLKTPIGKPGKANWQEVVAHRPGILLSDLELFEGHLVVFEKDTGVMKVRVIEQASGEAHLVDFPEPVYQVGGSGNFEFESTTLRLNYQSLVTPPSVLDYDMNSRRLSVVKTQEVVGYDPSQFVSERTFARASDGTMVPISLVYKKGLKKDGTNPCHLYGYGSYGFGMPTTFGSGRICLLDRGFVYAIAHIRGGNELGETWRADGKLKKKMNTFTDFIACAEALIAQGWTTPQQLIIEGGSAGGLLMGAVTNLRPDLFRAVVAQVPFVDVINTMLDETLPLTTGEFLEWGNPKKKADYAHIRAYSPYDNIAARAYPALYLRTSLNDSQVPYWEAAKFAARLRDLKTDEHPVILSINLDAGHGGASGRYEALKERAETLSFMLAHWGLAGAGKTAA
jgi:oligopeptidase B